MIRSSSDAKLVAGCLSGDPRSWDALIARYQGLIYTLARRMGLSAADADDIFQTVSLRLYQNLSELRDVTRLPSWLVSTTRREVWHLRRHKGPALLEDIAEGEIDLEAAQPVGREPEVTPEEMLIEVE